ncbi:MULTISPECIES: hypothetical protein [Bacillota]|uniref:hypothetical protein n=1 Tax=Bacillota TaxID=1239 RepID=UPI0039EF7E72
MRNKFPKWIFKERNDELAAFKNLRCVEGFSFAVRVGYDGVSVFGKNGERPSFFYMNEIELAKLEDFQGSKGEGFASFEVGCVRRDGGLWFAECLYNPGVLEEDFEELKLILKNFHRDCYERYLPTDKQLKRIQRMIDIRGKQFVESYYSSKFPEGDFEHLTKKQAQKIITGLQWIEPRKPIGGICVNEEWIS